MKHTIKLKNCLPIHVHEELIAAGAITPGFLIERTSANKVQAHSGAGQNVVPPMVALEDELQGKSIDDAYAATDRVMCWTPQRGDEGLMVLADGENIVIGDPLESNGAGLLRKHVPDTESLGADSSGNLTTIYTKPIVAVAKEAKDISASSGAESSGTLGYDKRIKVIFV